MFDFLFGLAVGVAAMLVPKVYTAVKAWYDERVNKP